METKNIMDRALKYLTRQAYSRKKLFDKLLKTGFSETETFECLERLVGWGYLDDRKFGIRQIELLQSKLKSRNYTKGYLLESGITSDLVDELLGQYYSLTLEVDIAQKFIGKKQLQQNRSKSQDWISLVRAGFDEDTVHKCFPNIYPT